MFVGEYEYKVDNKGRLPLPPKFRKEIEESVMLTTGADNCIIAYTKDEFAKLTQSQTQTSLVSSEDQRKFNRYIFSNTQEAAVDNQGRIALPSGLRERYGISDEAAVVGVNNSFEIWNPGNWQSQKMSIEDASALINRMGSKQ